MYADRLDVITGLAKRRGFVFPASEIYPGARGAWDYGPLGVELKNNIKRQWWRTLVTGRDDVVGLDASVIAGPAMWEASGHTQHFAEPLTECQACQRCYAVAALTAQFTELHGRSPAPGLSDVNCPDCGTRGTFTDPRMFSALLSTSLGPNPPTPSYLRPEGTTGIICNFANVQQTARKKPPFGVAQIGQVFRNEIAPNNFLFRTREFEQADLVFFTQPDASAEWHQYWIDARMQWYVDLGINKDHLRLMEIAPAHSSERSINVEYHFDFVGAEWGGLEAISNRSDRDMQAHAKASGADLTHYDQEKSNRWLPHVVSASAGINRAVLCFLLDAYSEDMARNAKGGTDKRVVLKLDYRLAPIKVAVLPLSRNPELSPRARSLADALRGSWNVEFDDAGAIGRRYRRQDEIGTPYCVTLDFATPNDNAVTVRERDSMSQERVSVDQLEGYLNTRLRGA
ncbi:MAG: glycine--tRNA ligase [Corynebacteriales bacterium]|nr:glycine--tRNA ligase [Mycobacteriales bacterium]